MAWSRRRYQKFIEEQAAKKRTAQIIESGSFPAYSPPRDISQRFAGPGFNPAVSIGPRPTQIGQQALDQGYSPMEVQAMDVAGKQKAQANAIAATEAKHKQQMVAMQKVEMNDTAIEKFLKPEYGLEYASTISDLRKQNRDIYAAQDVSYPEVLDPDPTRRKIQQQTASRQVLQKNFDFLAENPNYRTPTMLGCLQVGVNRHRRKWGEHTTIKFEATLKDWQGEARARMKPQITGGQTITPQVQGGQFTGRSQALPVAGWEQPAPAQYRNVKKLYDEYVKEAKASKKPVLPFFKWWKTEYKPLSFKEQLMEGMFSGGEEMDPEGIFK